MIIYKQQAQADQDQARVGLDALNWSERSAYAALVCCIQREMTTARLCVYLFE